MSQHSVFISYRRSDSTGEAGRLSDGLEALLGAACVFRDADGIAPGDDFAARLEGELAATSALLVLIGRRWAGELAARQASSEPDYVRREVATALRLGKRVIPVLLNGAELPRDDQLPADLRSLVRHQAVTLRDEAWNEDLGRLADAIGRPYAWRKLGLRAALVVPLILILTWYGVPYLAPPASDQLAWARSLVLVLLLAYAGGEWWLRRREVHRRA
ncbi:MAG: toll/interleukin-1 receptor domain-containing protein [Candidatus Accumulibacter sp.]|uniref:toll/interleukin-1 receptor domain-containing protein n=1 Tax=Accumulibacter sp. TaxID=2053492 RepID=UPI0028796764|nr:toll/interleukin-1 receptor domain-containing protein [Accumulibacter sp.]MDS4015058.1 toll/interleukin-1 receptor domain-containing protein [Accumulibacter sp.]